MGSLRSRGEGVGAGLICVCWWKQVPKELRGTAVALWNAATELRTHMYAEPVESSRKHKGWMATVDVVGSAVSVGGVAGASQLGRGEPVADSLGS